MQQGAPSELLAKGDSEYYAAAYDSARHTYEAAAQRAAGGGDSATVARALTSLGLVAWRQGRFDDAKSIGERALALKQRLRLQDDLAKSFNALGLLAHDRGQLDEALENFVAALAAAEAVHDSGYIAKARGNSGLVYQDLGDFDRARTEFLALRDAAAAMGNRLLEGNALNNLGMLETRVGDPTQAITWLGTARSRYAATNSAVGEENALGQLAVAYAERGEPSRAFAYLDSALAIATKSGLREPEADDLELMAELYENAGDHVRALDLLRRTRAICDSLEMGTKLGHIALAESHAYAALGNQSLARTRAREAAERQRVAGARSDELEARLFVAELAQRAGDSVEARQSLDTARTVMAQLSRGTARIKFALGAARVADLSRRSTEVLRALDASRADTSLLTAEERAEMESLRARANLRMTRYDAAADAGRRAVASLERIRQNLTSGAQRTSYVADRAQTYADLVIALLTMGRVDEAFRVADGARGRGLIEHLGAAKRDLPARGSAADIAAAENLLRRIDALINQLRSRDSTRSPDQNRSAEAVDGSVARQLADARHQYEEVLDRAARADPSSTILGMGGADLSAVRRVLARDEALIEFFSTSDRLVIFVVSRERVRWLEVPEGITALAERVHLARELIAARDPAADAPLRDLYAKLIAPVARAGLLTGVTSLLIVPHAALAYLPFAALRTNDASGRARYLAEEYSINTLASAAALPALRNRPGRFSSLTATVFAPLPSELPFTREEAEAVSAQVGRSSVSVGRAATEKHFRAALTNSTIVHVASHGTVNPESPMFSSIQLALPRTAERTTNDDNGRLETFEVLSLNIRSQLVFLSGCETALGSAWSTSYSHGDDYATLGQAFLFSGAANVVATLWRINDRGAADFAREFYRQLGKATAPAALAAAQRAFMRDDRYGAPYYWAAYTLSGGGVIARRDAM